MPPNELPAAKMEQKTQKPLRVCLHGFGMEEKPPFDGLKDPVEVQGEPTPGEIYELSKGLVTCVDCFAILSHKQEIQAIVAAGDDPEESGFSKAEIEDVFPDYYLTVQAE